MPQDGGPVSEQALGPYTILTKFNSSSSFKKLLIDSLLKLAQSCSFNKESSPKQKSIIEFDAFTKEIISDVYTEVVIDA